MGIPLRTLEEWEAGRRQMPEYILRLIAYYVKTQQLLETKTLKLDDDVLLQEMDYQFFNYGEFATIKML